MKRIIEDLTTEDVYGPEKSDVEEMKSVSKLLGRTAQLKKSIKMLAYSILELERKRKLADISKSELKKILEEE